MRQDRGCTSRCSGEAAYAKKDGEARVCGGWRRVEAVRALWLAPTPLCTVKPAGGCAMSTAVVVPPANKLVGDAACAATDGAGALVADGGEYCTSPGCGRAGSADLLSCRYIWGSWMRALHANNAGCADAAADELMERAGGDCRGAVARPGCEAGQLDYRRCRCSFMRERLPTFADVAGAVRAGDVDQARRTCGWDGRVQYTYSPALSGSGRTLTEVRMDASLTGDYRPLVQKDDQCAGTRQDVFCDQPADVYRRK